MLYTTPLDTDQAKIEMVKNENFQKYPKEQSYLEDVRCTYFEQM